MKKKQHEVMIEKILMDEPCVHTEVYMGRKSYCGQDGIIAQIPNVYSTNSYLTLEQMTVNAQYILDYLREGGWTKNAVCGMLGNLQTESTINPELWEDLDGNNLSKGFGLVQWKPASKFIDWANENKLFYFNINTQLMRLFYEIKNEIQWCSTSKYPLSFSKFIKSTQTPSYLAAVFMYNYVQPQSYSHLSTRQEQATYWYNNLI